MTPTDKDKVQILRKALEGITRSLAGVDPDRWNWLLAEIQTSAQSALDQTEE